MAASLWGFFFSSPFLLIYKLIGYVQLDVFCHPLEVWRPIHIMSIGPTPQLHVVQRNTQACTIQ